MPSRHFGLRLEKLPNTFSAVKRLDGIITLSPDARPWPAMASNIIDY